MVNGTKKAGFTLVEILVAAGILSLLLVVGYKVFSGFSRSFQKGSWSLTTQNKLRNALNFVREEMQKATSLTTVNLSGTTVTEVGYEFNLNAADELTADAEIANWAICLPYVTGDADSPGATFRAVLKLEGGKLVYSKSLEPGGSDPLNKEKTFTNHTIIDNVASVKITLEPFDIDNNTAGSLVSLEVKVLHPDQQLQPNAHVLAQTGAKVEVEVVR